jgi:hypothetical protein
MTADHVLARTFAEHEHLAPDADATLAGITDRLNRPRRTGPVLAAAAAAAVVVVGATVVLHHDPAPVQAAARPAAPATAPPAAVPPAAAPQSVSLAAAWLPAGTVTPGMLSSGYGTDVRLYDVADADGGSTDVLLTAGAGAGEDAKFGSPRSTTIGGRPAREWSVPGRYTVVVREPGGRDARVDVSSYGRGGVTARPAATVATLGRQVAAHLRLDRPQPLRPAFRLGYAPAGLPVRAVTVDPLSGTAYELAPARATAGHATLVVQTMPTGAAINAKGTAPTTPGTPVQGHPTIVEQTGNGPTLLVRDLRPGTSIRLSPDQTRGPDLATLYRIARTIAWTS